MRIMTIGYSLPNPIVDNHTVLNAPSLTDYDAALIDPRRSRQRSGSCLKANAPSTPRTGGPW